ncbi:MAG: DUF177 domain-containing protein [Acidimicrobiales bacterium]|nr:DUF177 domain-containing protein [Acidimicrobiales bacterium]
MSSRRPFVVSIATLRHRAEQVAHVACQGVIPDLEVAGTRVPPGAEVAVEALVEVIQGGVLVSGTVEAPWEAQCRRCLEAARGQVRVRVRELYSPQASPDDEDVYPLAGEQLDLEPLARDAVLLELPLAPLCSEGCRGLCPVCGVDRNRVTCACVSDQLDPRWAALDVLRRGGSE